MSKFEAYPEGTFTLEQYRSMTPEVQDAVLRTYRNIPEVYIAAVMPEYAGETASEWWGHPNRGVRPRDVLGRAVSGGRGGSSAA